MSSVLSVQNLTKFYGPVQALDGVSFGVPQGSVFGILGPNGSGKTTLLGIIMDVLKPTSGTYLLNGRSGDADTRKGIGTLLETPNFYHYLSGAQNLRIAAGIKGRGGTDIDSVLQKVALYERRHSKFSTYSLGMKQRLAIASALLGNPDLLVFDEPTNGLDPVGIAEIRELIRRLATEGKTIIMASHLLDEVEKVCDHVAILKRGKLVAAGHVDEVLVNEDIVEVSASDLPALEAALTALNGFTALKRGNDSIQLYYPAGTSQPERINEHCFGQGVVLNHLQIKKKSLEAKFFELTQ